MKKKGIIIVISVVVIAAIVVSVLLLTGKNNKITISFDSNFFQLLAIYYLQFLALVNFISFSQSILTFLLFQNIQKILEYVGSYLDLTHQ